MPASIHPTAIIEPGAELGADVQIGAYAFVGTGVQLGAGTQLHHHASVEGRTSLGTKCELFPYACIGGKTQDLKYKGGRPGLRIGERNVFREYVTVHTATFDDEFTVIGSDNTILAYSHIAHDCIVGNRCILANGAQVGGHCVIADGAFLSGNACLHQFVRVGRFALLSGCSVATKDMPPFMVHQGINIVHGVNIIGLRRAGIPTTGIDAIRKCYHILYREGLSIPGSCAKITEELGHIAEARELVDFIAVGSRGISLATDRTPNRAAA